MTISEKNFYIIKILHSKESKQWILLLQLKTDSKKFATQ